MPGPFVPALAGLGVSVLGAGAAWYLGNRAEEERRRAGMESIRRTDRERAYTLGEATASGAASGVEFGSESLQKYLADMSAEFRRQHDFAVGQVRRGESLGKLANAFGFASTLGSSLFSYGQARKWGMPAPTAAAGREERI